VRARKVEPRQTEVVGGELKDGMAVIKDFQEEKSGGIPPARG
jgi:hypothetical protein